MRLLLRLSVMTALALLVLLPARPTSASPKVWTTTVSVTCDSSATVVTGNFYRNKGNATLHDRDILTLDGYPKGDYVLWGLTCPGSPGTISNSWTTKFAPTDVVIAWTSYPYCSVSRGPFPVPTTQNNTAQSQPPPNCNAYFNVTVEVSTPVQN
jgi:hypothetical protein